MNKRIAEWIVNISALLLIGVIVCVLLLILFTAWVVPYLSFSEWWHMNADVLNLFIIAGLLLGLPSLLNEGEGYFALVSILIIIYSIFAIYINFPKSNWII